MCIHFFLYYHQHINSSFASRKTFITMKNKICIVLNRILSLEMVNLVEM